MRSLPNNPLLRSIRVVNADFGKYIQDSGLFDIPSATCVFICNNATNNPIGNGVVILIHSDSYWDKHPTYIATSGDGVKTGSLDCADITALKLIWWYSKAKICTQQIYAGAIYKDCNDLPVGESAIAFRTALHKPQNDDSIWFIFCMGAPSDGIKYQVAIQYLYTLVVKTRTWNSTNEVWNDWK